MMSIDELTADILDALASQGKLANTLVAYASDNGQLWGEHHYTGKNVPYRRATEVPLYLRWDHHIPQGSVKDRIALNVDLTATIAKVAGVDMPWSEGRSLIRSPQRKGFVVEASAQYPPTPERPAYCGWRTLNRMYVRYSTGEEELYLYKRDPYRVHQPGRPISLPRPGQVTAGQDSQGLSPRATRFLLEAGDRPQTARAA